MSSEPNESQLDSASPSGSTAGDPGDSPLATPRVVAVVFTAAVVAWIGVSWVPAFFNTPEELLGVDLYSPPDLQRAAAENQEELYWKNGVVRTTMMGICFGAVPAVLAFIGGVRRPIVPAVGGLVTGLVAGVAAFFAGAALRSFLDTGYELPLVGDASNALIGDSLVLGLVGLLLGLPIAVGIALMGLLGGGQKAASAPLAGLLAGFLVPMVASFAIPNQNSSEFPPSSPAFAALMLGSFAILVVLLAVSTGDRKRSAVAASGEAAATE